MWASAASRYRSRSTSFADLDLLADPQFDNVAGVRMRLECCRTVMLALAVRLDLRRRVDLLRPGTVQRQHRGESADEIRLKMRRAGITEASLMQPQP
jgi:hypothetical protein